MWRSFLHSRYAPLLTHASLLLLTALLFALLLGLPFWIAFVPCALVQHRIGVLLHEYIHGIPFRRYRANLAVLSVTPREPAYLASRQQTRNMWSRVAALEGVQHLIYLAQSLRGRHPGVIPLMQPFRVPSDGRR